MLNYGRERILKKIARGNKNKRREMIRRKESTPTGEEKRYHCQKREDQRKRRKDQRMKTRGRSQEMCRRSAETEKTDYNRVSREGKKAGRKTKDLYQNLKKSTETGIRRRKGDQGRMKREDSRVARLRRWQTR